MDSELQDLPSKLQSRPNLEDKIDQDDRPLLSPTTTTKSLSSTPPASIEELKKKYAAYVRHEVYGTMGRGDVPWTEKLLLGIALVRLLPVRVVPNEQEDYAHMGGRRRSVLYWSGRVLSRVMCFAFGFYWIQETRREIPGLPL